MKTLLEDQFIEYLNSKKAHLIPIDKNSINVRTEIVSDINFDIMDKQPTIKVDIGTGSATYNNPSSITIVFIDYENLINQLPEDHQKGIKRPDFICYEDGRNSFFIINELSQSSNSNNKINEARQQLHSALLHLSRCSETKSFMDNFERKECVFSNKTKLIETPDNIADSFALIQDYLPEPIEHDYHPIKQLGFKFIETAVITL